MAQPEFQTHPQPRTFAPSKEDVLQNLMYFFGAPVSPEKLKDYSEHHVSAATRTHTHAYRMFITACSCLRLTACVPVVALTGHDLPLPRCARARAWPPHSRARTRLGRPNSGPG